MAFGGRGGALFGRQRVTRGVQYGMENEQQLLNALPSVSSFLNSREGGKLSAAYGEGLLKFSLRKELDRLRSRLRSGSLSSVPPIQEIVLAVERRIRAVACADARRAVNATGIILHTGLGRAPLCPAAIEAVEAAARYTPLQVDLEDGGRSLREEKVEALLAELTGCEAATVVNNNAAATMLVLNTLCGGRETVISRGQLIEIGGEFRLPDVMERSGTTLREVGTTNKTHLCDYEKAASEQTGAVLHVHTSNYRIRGFASVPDITQLCSLKKKYPGLLVIDDLGSGALVSLSTYGIPDEPLVADSMRAGADVACFSGDKLICGPQSGIICGKREIIQKIRKNPYARMFRVCKLTLAALEATLAEFVAGTYAENLPLYAALGRTGKELDADARKLLKAVGSLPGMKVEIVDDLSYLGSGSAPDEGVPSKVLSVSGGKATFKPDTVAATLRKHVPPVFCRIKDDALRFDVRTLGAGQIVVLAEAIRTVVTQ